MLSTVLEVDENTSALVLEVPEARIVLLQSLFESYEGLGIVRTVDWGRGDWSPGNTDQARVIVLTTPSMLNQCIALLESLQGLIPWRYVSGLDEQTRERYLSY